MWQGLSGVAQWRSPDEKSAGVLLRTCKLAALAVACFLIFQLCLAGVASQEQEGEIVRGEFGQRLDAYLARLEKFGFSGALLVAQAGEVILARGYGLADRARAIPFTAQTVSTIGSITKQFTAAAILKLEMQGKLRVEDPISKYFANVPADKAGITLHHLLTHTAGLKGDFGGRDSDPIARDALVRLVLSAPLASPPGTRYEYSNEGYSLLGAIVEIVSGQPYERYLYENLFQPAGMHSTGYVIPQWGPEPLARGYTEGQDWGTIVEKGWQADGPGWYLKANGGIHSTIGDMYKWHLALAGDAILSKAAKEKYFKPYVAEGPRAQSFYAYGWAVFTTPRKTQLIAHSGGNGVFFADFLRYVDENVVVLALSNAGVSAIDVSAQVSRIIFGMDYVLPPPVVAMEPALLARYAGSYQLASGEQIAISTEGDKLKVSGSGSATFALLNFLTPAGSSRYAVLEARTRALLEAAARGDYQPLHEALGARIPLEQFAERESKLWQGRRQRYGELKSIEILGSGPRGPGVVVHVRMSFARGMQLVQYVWAGETLMGLRLLEKLPPALFLPQSATEFAAFDIRQPSLVRLRFSLGEAGGVSGLTLVAADNELRAKKTQ